MPGPSLTETTAFVAVVELKSFTKAAKQLALSPPRVSELVRNLEERLGVRLVERTTHIIPPLEIVHAAAVACSRVQRNSVPSIQM